MRAERTQADDGVGLAFRVREGLGEPVVLIHGWMLSGAVWNEVLEHLQTSRPVLVPDLRGTGASDRPDGGFTLPRFADDLLAVLRAFGSAKAVWVGHSMGGQLAQLVAARSPEAASGLVLVCPVPAAGMALPPDAHGLFLHSAGNRQMQGTILDVACGELPPDARERLLDDAGTLSVACVQQAYAAWTGGFPDALDAVTAPALVVASDDPFLPAAFLRTAVVDRLPRARLAVLPGPGHYPLVERPAATAALIDAFLAGLG